MGSSKLVLQKVSWPLAWEQEVAAEGYCNIEDLYNKRNG